MLTLFSHIGLLPIAYLLIVMCVVCCGLAGKVLAGSLIKAIPEPIGHLLSRPIGITTTGDHILDSIFESTLFNELVHRLFPELGAFGFQHCVPVTIQQSTFFGPSCRDGLYEGKYWSGCPPR